MLVKAGELKPETDDKRYYLNPDAVSSTGHALVGMDGEKGVLVLEKLHYSSWRNRLS
jgi:hypothetical protein